MQRSTHRKPAAVSAARYTASQTCLCAETQNTLASTRASLKLKQILKTYREHRRTRQREAGNASRFRCTLLWLLESGCQTAIKDPWMSGRTYITAAYCRSVFQEFAQAVSLISSSHWWPLLREPTWCFVKRVVMWKPVRKWCNSNN